MARASQVRHRPASRGDCRGASIWLQSEESRTRLCWPRGAPLRESELRGKAPSPSTSPPLWRGPLTPTLSPACGEREQSVTRPHDISERLIQRLHLHKRGAVVAAG